MDGLFDMIKNSPVIGFEGFVFIVAIVGVSAFLTTYNKRSKGAILIEQIKKLDNDTYHLISDVSLDGIEHPIDHIVLSVYGVLIINRKVFKGNVYGSEADQDWTIRRDNKVKTFANPLAEIEKNISKIATELDVQERHIYPIVSFSNEVNLEVEQALIRNGKVCNYDSIGDAIKAHHTPQLAKTKVAELVEQLETDE